jgi:acetyl esterase
MPFNYRKTIRLLFATGTFYFIGISCFRTLDTADSRIADFGAVFDYPADSFYFDKGAGIITRQMVGSEPLRVRLCKPNDWAATDRRPCLIMFYGGGWKVKGAPQFKWFKNFFIDKGYMVIIADYRLGAPIERRAIPDGKSAVRWVRTHADSLGVDPQKIVALGSSAGGHLAASTGTVKGFEHAGENLAVSSRPNCIIACWPVLDLTLDYGEVAESVDKKVVSPAWCVDDSTPPTLIITGGDDQFFPGMQQFMTNAKSFSFDRLLRIFPGVGHNLGFRAPNAIERDSPGEDSTLAWTVRFLEQHGMAAEIKK